MAKRPAEAARPLDAECRVVLLHGPDDFLRSEYTAKLKEALQAVHPDLDTLRYEGASAKAADVLDECRSFGLMRQHKLIVVDQADQLVKEANRPLFEKYAEGPAEDATLVLRADKWYPGNLDKLIAKVGVVIKCDEVTEAQALTWSMARAKKRHDAVLEEPAARLLVERVGAQLGRIDSELAKLATAAGPGGSITREAVAAAVGATREEEAWAIQQTLLSGDTEATLKQLRDIIEVSRQSEAAVSWAVIDLLRKLHAASAGLRAGRKPFDLMKALKLWGPSAEVVMNAARHVDPARARRLFLAAVEADTRQKTGLSEPLRSLESLVVGLAPSDSAGMNPAHRPQPR